MPSRSWTAVARPESVGELRQGAADFLREYAVADGLRDDLRLAVSEALSNAVVHAFRDDLAPGTVHLDVGFDRAEGVVEVTIADDGMGLAPRADSPGIGLGMPLIHRLADEVEYRTPRGGGTEVWMRFRL